MPRSSVLSQPSSIKIFFVVPIAASETFFPPINLDPYQDLANNTSSHLVHVCNQMKPPDELKIEHGNTYSHTSPRLPEVTH